MVRRPLPIANYLNLVREFLHPGDIHLPTKSDRAATNNPLVKYQILSDFSSACATIH